MLKTYVENKKKFMKKAQLESTYLLCIIQFLIQNLKEIMSIYNLYLHLPVSARPEK